MDKDILIENIKLCLKPGNCSLCDYADTESQHLTCKVLLQDILKFLEEE